MELKRMQNSQSNKNSSL